MIIATHEQNKIKSRLNIPYDVSKIDLNIKHNKIRHDAKRYGFLYLTFLKTSKLKINIRAIKDKILIKMRPINPDEAYEYTKILEAD